MEKEEKSRGRKKFDTGRGRLIEEEESCEKGMEGRKFSKARGLWKAAGCQRESWKNRTVQVQSACSNIDTFVSAKRRS